MKRTVIKQRAVLCLVAAGYLANVWKLDDLIVLVHCPESPKLPTLSFKSTAYNYSISFSLSASLNSSCVGMHNTRPMCKGLRQFRGRSLFSRDQGLRSPNPVTQKFCRCFRAWTKFDFWPNAHTYVSCTSFNTRYQWKHNKLAQSYYTPHVISSISVDVGESCVKRKAILVVLSLL